MTTTKKIYDLFNKNINLNLKKPLQELSCEEKLLFTIHQSIVLNGYGVMNNADVAYAIGKYFTVLPISNLVDNELHCQTLCDILILLSQKENEQGGDHSDEISETILNIHDLYELLTIEGYIEGGNNPL